MNLIKRIRTKNGDAQIDYESLANLPLALPASDVYPWAKKSKKPAYTADEVGALPDTTFIPSVDDTLSVSGAAADANITGTKIEELRNSIESLIQLLRDNNVIE